MMLLTWCAGAFVSSVALTMAVRAYALRRNILDIANERSSHVGAVPRGGGVAFVVTFLVLALWLAPGLGLASIVPVVVSGAAVAVVGFLDDHAHVAPSWRLAAHFTAAGWAVSWIHGLPPISFFGSEVDLGLLGSLLAVIYLVWLLNLYNFMDGIDGIAGIEAITACAGGAFLAWHLGASPSMVVLPLVLASSVAGFLVWNFPVARIFMGDAGSGFLGIVLGVFSLLAAWQESRLVWSWIILLGVFVVDATTTLLRRMVRREQLHKAHRSHAYQYAARRWRSHPRVSLAAGLINAFWLFPWAWAVAAGAIDGATAVMGAYAPLVLLALKFHAGAQEKQVAG